MDIQTTGFTVIGDLPNDEKYHCLTCDCVPERVWQNLYVVEPEDTPATLPVPPGIAITIVYRLCPACHEAGSEPWKIRVLLLARLHENLEKIEKESTDV